MKHDMNRRGFLKALTGGELKKAFRDRDVAFSATVFNGVNFIVIDDVYGTVT